MKRTFQTMMDNLAVQYAGYLNIRRNPPISGKYPSAVPLPIPSYDIPCKTYSVMPDVF